MIRFIVPKYFGKIIVFLGISIYSYNSTGFKLYSMVYHLLSNDSPHITRTDRPPSHGQAKALGAVLGLSALPGAVSSGLVYW